MGCSGSKADDLPLVVRCRERRELIRAAADHRYALAAAHVSYFRSLNDVGDALRKFVDEELISISASSSPSSPSLSNSTSADKSLHLHDDEEESHLHLSESSSDNDGDSEGDYKHQHHEHHSHDSNDQHHEYVHKGKGFNDGVNNFHNTEKSSSDDPGGGFYGYGYGLMNDPSIYPTTQRHMDQRWYYSNNANVYYTKNSATAMKTAIQDPAAYGYSDSYWNYPVDYGGDYGYFPMGSAVRMRNSEGVKVSPQKEAPPPPSPKVLSWDLFNPFVAFDGGYAGYYPIGTYGYGSNSTSPDLSEVRKREGIPDLEEETENELHKEALKGKRMNAEAKKRSRTEPIQNNIESSSKSVPQSSEERLKPSVSPHNEGYSWSKSVDEGSVKKKGVNTEVDSSRLSSVTVLSPRGTRDLKEVVAEIRDDFEIASGYGREVALMLEVEKMPYRPGFLRVILSRILYLITSLLKLRGSPSMQSVKLASTSKKSAKSYFEDVGKDVNATVYNLSSTLDKLYAWEKKLHKEVKDEERIRIKYEKQYKRLKVLDEEGAESSKIYAAQTSIRRLRTKLDVSIKAIDVISSRIDKLRDEELQPKVAALIHGLIRMWKAMLKCHQKQFRAIMEIKTQKLRVKTCLQTDSSLRTTTELENELRSWCHRFNEWIGFQKSYVESLNGWLLKCLQFEPEQEFSDRPFFYSPSQLGAPSIFIICNDWHKALESISEGKVAKPLNAFATSLHQLWEKQDNEEHQAEYLLMDYEKLLRTRRLEKMERGQDSSLSPLNLDSLRHRLVQERRKHKDSMKLVHNAASCSLRGGLVPIFKALENFTSEALKVHEQVRLQHPMVELTHESRVSQYTKIWGEPEALT